ncbi:MAG TPA: histidine kinase dimerization/phospho-acceptor domain-containing protein [Myxococcaceae bacterium]|jgi:signal transduction histidine kinase
MDPLLLDSVSLAWGPDLVVASAAGPAEHVLGRPASQCGGRPLAEVLSVAPPVVRELHDRVRPGDSMVEHLTSVRGEHTAHLRLHVLAGERGRCTASVLNLTVLMDGWPPPQISKLASSLSHEIRNPLSSVKMAVQTLARNQGYSAKDKRRLTIANREIRTMERMLSLLSEYGREAPLRTKVTSVRALLQAAASKIEEELGEQQVVLAFEEEDSDLPPVKANEESLQPVLSHLLLNVAQGLEKGARLGITLRRSGNGAQAVIADPSAVFPGDQRKLYEPFASNLARGAGLMLAALRRVMASHGGEFIAEGTGSLGMRYTLTFTG